MKKEAFAEESESECLDGLGTLLEEMKNDITVSATPIQRYFYLKSICRNSIQKMRSIKRYLTIKDEAEIQAYPDVIATV